jgi:signal transduction histidine kinase
MAIEPAERRFLPPPGWGVAVRYGVALALGALALVMSFAVPTVGVMKVSFITSFTLLVGLAAWFGGAGPGLVCTVLCTLGVVIWLEPPQSLAIGASEEIVGAVMFGVVGVGLSLIAGNLHRSLRAEHAARQKAERAVELERAAREMRDEMMAMVAHDLRSPLSAIGLGITAIGRTAPRDPMGNALHGRVAALHRIVTRMSIMVGDLVDWTALDAGRLSVTLNPEPCEALLDESMSLFLPEAEVRGVRLAKEAPAAALLVRADHNRVLQVLSNLTSNALKFTPKGGEVTLGAQPVDGFVRFTVHDTGSGFRDAELAHLFERWYRAPGQQVVGSGLGLHIAKVIVEAHGGEIRAESKKDLGSTFSFTLPAA